MGETLGSAPGIRSPCRYFPHRALVSRPDEGWADTPSASIGTARAAYRREKETAETAIREASQAMKDADKVYLDAISERDDAKKATSRVAHSEASQALRDAREAEKAALQRLREIERSAKAAYLEALERANTAYDEATQSATDAWMESQREARQARQTEVMQETMNAAVAALEAARSRAADAYIAAYANPGPDLYRDIAGYDKDIVLKMALAERELCPD